MTAATEPTAAPAYDVVIVGSGISGAMMAKQLGEAGKKVLILEAGAPLPVNIDGYLHTFFQSPAKVPESPYIPNLFSDAATFTLANPTLLNAPRPTVLTLSADSWQNQSQSYLDQQGPTAFASTYERTNAGTARHWLGTTLRHVPHDFAMRSTYGVEIDWPLTYADLEDWYGQAEAEIGVSANVADQAYLGITFPAGYEYPMPALPNTLVDQYVAAAVDGKQLDGATLTVTTTPAGRNSRPYQNRRACGGNTNCIPICPIQAKYDPSVTLNAALQTGNVTIQYQTVAVSVDLAGDDTNIGGISWVQYDGPDGGVVGRGTATGTIYVLAAHAIETPKLLLMSTNGGKTPNGIANSSDQVGRNLMDHPLYLAWGLASKQVFPYRGPLSTSGIESLRDGAFREDRAAFRIEIGNEGWNFPGGDPYTSLLAEVLGDDESQIGTAGAALVATLNGRYTRQFRMAFLVEQTPDPENRVTLSPTWKDKLGLPRPQIHYQLSDYTKAGFAAARQTADQLFAWMGAEQVTDKNPAAGPTTFSYEGQDYIYYGAGHVVGTCRMGGDAATSVVDANLRTWDHPNLYILGSSVFPTIATANPTLTIAALALRAAATVLTQLG
ncbi:GMC family oxidoreductase [Azospirillum sp. B4]|uniref:GMC family oxidoreductase n=1 Tax=Azospirillum sp. B4 TaxID=95605 RepID=UPI000344B817|nr:GMC family oxidoreductase [Azospirillum sp. B4]